VTDRIARPRADGDPRLAAPSVALLAANVVAGIIAFAFAVIVATRIGPSGRGIVAFATTIAITASWLSLMGLDVAFLYYCGSEPDRRPAIAASAVVGGISTGVVGAAVATLILAVAPQLAPDPITTTMLAVGLATTPFISVQRLLNATLIGSGRIAAANTIVVALPTLALASFLTIGLTRGSTAGTAVAAWAMSRVIGAIAATVIAWRTVGLAGGESLRAALWPSVRYGVRAYAGSVASQPVRRFDTFVLAAVAPASQLGYYTAAVNISEVGMYLPNAVASILLPRSAGRDEREAARMVHRAAATVLGIVAAGALVGIVIAPALIEWLFGARFEASTIPLQLMLVAMIGASARRTFEAGLLARNRAGIVSLLTLASLALIVVLDLALIPRWGASGAALASAIAYCVAGVTAYFVYRSGLDGSTREMLPPLRVDFVDGIRSTIESIRARRTTAGDDTELDGGSLEEEAHRPPQDPAG
jgi:O-antigen/teichoic acid export membrane protein